MGRIAIFHQASFGTNGSQVLPPLRQLFEYLLRRLPNGDQQVVRVQHVGVNDSGQAVIGNEKESDG
jgi:hypothetical protein